jgi:hypothetical protein
MAYGYTLLYVALYKVNFNHFDISAYMASRGTLLQRFEETEILKKTTSDGWSSIMTCTRKPYTKFEGNHQRFM